MLYEEILRGMEHRPTEEQDGCIRELCDFMYAREEHKCFMLRGYAGTGKTTVISGFINAMKRVGWGTVLMAPTGRAAKVLGNYSGHSATSIHKGIYRQNRSGGSEFSLNYNKYKNTIFIVDEASMISNYGGIGSSFGSGRLLDDLVEYVYSGDNCQMVLLGDDAQLKPIGEGGSPAMEKGQLGSYGLDVYGYTLTKVLRQSEESGILRNATLLRGCIEDEERELKLDDSFGDVERVSGEDLIDKLTYSYDMIGMENTTIITYSNKRSILYSRGVRNQVLQREDEISNGDMIVVTKNNYYWNREYDGIDFIANGESGEIKRIRKYYDIYGMKFADVTLRLIDSDREIDARILLDSLYSETQGDVNKMNNKLLEGIMEDYADVKDKRELWKLLKEDGFWNALQVKFSYGITCHKAQGGQWKHVYIEQPYMPNKEMSKEQLQWLYTAITRAECKVFFINFSDIFFDSQKKGLTLRENN